MPVSKEIYEERKAGGLCTRCGKIAVENKTLCIYHLEKANKNQKAVHARRKSNGSCFKCGKKLTNNRKTCNDCLNKNVEMDRPEIYIPNNERRKFGLCHLCGEPSRKYNCPKCISKHKLLTPSIRQQRIDNGMCGVCGKGLLAKGHKRCIICVYKMRKWYASSEFRIKQAVKTQNLRKKVIAYYGNKCVCCGETEYTFLAIDHINGGGNEHRRKIKKNGSNILKWLVTQNFPKEFQILCHNCNMSKYLNGGVCAHKSPKT